MSCKMLSFEMAACIGNGSTQSAIMLYHETFDRMRA